MFRTLTKVETLAVEDHTFIVRYFELRTQRGARRYSAEIPRSGRATTSSWTTIR